MLSSSCYRRVCFCCFLFLFNLPENFTPLWTESQARVTCQAQLMAVPMAWRVCVGTELLIRGSTAFSHPAARDKASSRAGFGRLFFFFVVLMPLDIQSSSIGNKFCCLHFRAGSSGCQKTHAAPAGFGSHVHHFGLYL